MLLMQVCVNTYISETSFQSVAWVECSSAHTKGLVLPHNTLDVDNLQIMIWTNTLVQHAFETCFVGRTSSEAQNQIKSEWYLKIIFKNHFSIGTTYNDLILPQLFFLILSICMLFDPNGMSFEEKRIK